MNQPEISSLQRLAREVHVKDLVQGGGGGRVQASSREKQGSMCMAH